MRLISPCVFLTTNEPEKSYVGNGSTFCPTWGLINIKIANDCLKRHGLAQSHANYVGDGLEEIYRRLKATCEEQLLYELN